MSDHFFVDAFASTGSAIGTRRRLDELMAAAVLVDHFNAHVERRR
jgi:hypothetical protein